MPSEPIKKQRSTRSPETLCAVTATNTNILVLRRWIDPAELPDEMAISAITLAELSAAHTKYAGTTSKTPTTNTWNVPAGSMYCSDRSELVSVPFDAEAARIYGRVSAAVIASGRKPRRRTVDLMIAATAIAEDLPLFTTNPEDFKGLTTC